MSLPWNERVPMLQINPEAARIADIVRLAEIVTEVRKIAAWLPTSHLEGCSGPYCPVCIRRGILGEIAKGPEERKAAGR